MSPAPNFLWGRSMTADAVEAMLPTAAALAVAVSDWDQEAVAAALHPLDRNGLYALAIALAANVDLDLPLTADTKPLTYDSISTRAINIAAQLFLTDATSVLSQARGRNVLDARAVAMYACRLVGLSSPQVGARFNRDHSTVLHACGRVGESPRLRGIGQRVAVQCGWVREREAMSA